MQHSPETIEVVSEEAVIEKRDVVTGKVRVSTRTHTETEMVAAVLNEDTVSVERVAINQEVATAPSIRTEGDVTIIPVLEEILVVEKRLLLREELHVRRSVSQTTVEAPVELRRQTAQVERSGGDTNPSEEDFSNEPSH
jgi:uncharacterized protein (TIGR02271 family)